MAFLFCHCDFSEKDEKKKYPLILGNTGSMTEKAYLWLKLEVFSNVNSDYILRYVTCRLL